MTTDLTCAIIALSLCLWILVIHIQTPVELLIQTIISENNSIMEPDNNSAYVNLYQESFDIIPIGCKVTKAITNKSMNETGIINFLQFPNGIIQASGEINDVIKHDFSNFYLEIDNDKGANI